MIYFDIETRPDPMLGPNYGFDPDTVKVNKSDTAEIKSQKIQNAYEKHMTKIMTDVFTAEVCALGIIKENPEDFEMITSFENSDYGIVSYFWKVMRDIEFQNKHQVGGYNIKQFDLPFMVKRAWKHGISVPKWAFTTWKGRIYWGEIWVDIRDIWTFGDKYAPGKLDDVCKFVGIPGKTEDLASKFYLTLEEDPKRAKEYLKADCEACMNLHQKIAV